MHKEDITHNPYLSCVEAYYLAWLSQYTDVRKLYCRSFIELGEVVEDFIAEAQYATYDKISRLQDFGEALEITKHTRRVRFACGQQSALTLIKVNESFGGTLTPWRDDHYIAVVRNKNRRYDYVNQYPLSCGTFSLEELLGVYGDVTLVYKYCGAFNEELYYVHKQKTIARIKERLQPFSPAAIAGTALRDAVGVLRISRERTYLWLLCEGCDAPALRAEISALQKLYFKVSADLQRGRAGIDYANDWANILRNEVEWRQEI